MKKVFAVILALCLMIPPALAEGAPLLYRVTDGEGHTLYLFGTIHVGDAEMYDTVEASVFGAMMACDRVAVEIDPVALANDVRASFLSLSKMVLTQTDSIRNYLSDETVDLGIKLLDQPEAFLLRAAPIMWYSLVENLIYANAGFDGNYGADTELTYQAYERDIEVVSLESYAEQLGVFEKMSNELLDFMIGTMLKDLDKYTENGKALMAAWKEGDADALARILGEEDEVPPELQAEYDAYMGELVTKRDDGFLEDALRFLKEDETTLIAIGAAHIVGENGLAARLRALGYTVEVVERYISAAL